MVILTLVFAALFAAVADYHSAATAFFKGVVLVVATVDTFRVFGDFASAEGGVGCALGVFEAAAATSDSDFFWFFWFCDFFLLFIHVSLLQGNTYLTNRHRKLRFCYFEGF